jgi:hypothetical protein
MSSIQEQLDLKWIRNRYEKAYRESLNTNCNTLDYHIEDWHSVLNEVQRVIYDEIKSAGVRLYPFYPIGSGFINFGNPFKRIGIEILYKNFGFKEKQEKIERFKIEGWTVYTFETKYISYILEKLFDNVKDEYYGESFEELDSEDKLNFIEKYMNTNLECLMYHIREELYEETDYALTGADIEPLTLCIENILK